jgi:hypothetical protein
MKEAFAFVTSLLVVILGVIGVLVSGGFVVACFAVPQLSIFYAPLGLIGIYACGMTAFILPGVLMRWSETKKARE